ncbi:hypothetical protein PR048_006127, partial [Dryococelus australis]
MADYLSVASLSNFFSFNDLVIDETLSSTLYLPAVKLLACYQGVNRVQSPAGHSVFACGNRAGRWSASFFGDLPSPPPGPFIPAPLHTHIHDLISSQDLAVEIHSNLFTHSYLPSNQSRIWIYARAVRGGVHTVWRKLNLTASNPHVLRQRRTTALGEKQPHLLWRVHTVRSEHNLAASNRDVLRQRRTTALGEKQLHLLRRVHTTTRLSPRRTGLDSRWSDSPDLLTSELCRTMPLVEEFSRGVPASPALAILASLSHTQSPDTETAQIFTLHCSTLAKTEFLIFDAHFYRTFSLAQIPGWVTGFFPCGNRSGQCRWLRGFSQGPPVSPALSFRCCCKLTSITLIGIQDLDVKSRLNLFTHPLAQTYFDQAEEAFQIRKINTNLPEYASCYSGGQCSMSFNVTENRYCIEALWCIGQTTHLGEPGSIPGKVTPGFTHVRIVLDDAAGRRVFSRISRFPRPCIPAPLPTRLSRAR